jgi:O-antigen/teichoic acid export membrane protein
VLLVGTIVDLLANIVLGRLLGPENYGDYSVALGVAMICANLANLGSSETLPKFFRVYFGSGRFGLAAGFLRSTLIARSSSALRG